MNILFIDESNTPLPKEKIQADKKFFVLSGLIIPTEHWKELNTTFNSILTRYKIQGEIKWRFFSPHKTGVHTSISHLSDEEKSNLRFNLLEMIGSKSYLKSISVICDLEQAYNMPTIHNPTDIYETCYKSLLERFQYCLQDKEKYTNRQELGMIICDSRNARDNNHLRETHHRILNKEIQHASDFNNIIGTVFFAPSDKSMGIQLVDLVAGSVCRKRVKNDDTFYRYIRNIIRRNPEGKAEGWGIVFIPHK
ncbi:MAG: DUF3800 domain-containing protein [Elusimicrobiaceae bacterium]|nr:DUF3800 domain-containing protein [Elusimicrobiaceae bacterium]